MRSENAFIKKVIPISAKELMEQKIESIPQLVDPIFPKSGLVCLAGSSDTGKSTFLRQLCLHVVSEKEDRFIGFSIKAVHRRAFYISTEDDKMALQFLLQKQNRDNRYPYNSLDGLKFILETDNLLENLDQILTESPADLVVIDCLADVFGGKGSFNEATQVRAFLNPYKELADKHQCLVIFLHHTGKRTDQFEPHKSNLLGSQAIEAKMRMVAELRVDPDDSTLRHLCIVKGNYLPKEYKNESFELRFNDDMIFKNTGNRKPFEELQKRSPERSPEKREQLIEQAKLLRSQGKSQRDISGELGIGLGTVNNYLKPVHVQPNTNV
jgi:RecA-family ATPase